MKLCIVAILCAAIATISLEHNIERRQSTMEESASLTEAFEIDDELAMESDLCSVCQDLANGSQSVMCSILVHLGYDFDTCMNYTISTICEIIQVCK